MKIISRQFIRCVAFGGLSLVISLPCFAQYVVGGYSYTCPVGMQWSDPRCVREYIGPSADSHQPTQPQRQWRKTWGAISFDSTTGHYGVTINKRSEAEARRIAETRCGLEGSKNCSRAFTYVNQCAVLAFPVLGTGSIVARSGPDTQGQREKAIFACQKSGAKKCEVVYEDCSRPVLD